MRSISMAAIVLAGFLLAACSASSGGSAGTSAPASTATVTRTATSSAPTSTAPTSTAPSTPPASTTSSSQAATNACFSTQLGITTTTAGGATGHDGYVLLFRNTSAHTCTLHGYPGLDALRTGHAPVHAIRTLYGFMGGSKHGLPDVTLRPGHSASARVEYTFASKSYPGGNCPTAPRIAVTAANTLTSVKLDARVTICNLQIHPTVSGTSGDDN